MKIFDVVVAQKSCSFESIDSTGVSKDAVEFFFLQELSSTSSLS